MSAQTLSGIMQRIETVLQSDPLNLTLNPDPFTDMGIPNSLVDISCRVLPGGVVNDQQTSNFQSMRIDRITVIVQRTLNFSGYDAIHAMEDLMDEIERAVIADCTDHFYMVSIEKGSRKVTKKKDSDVCEASINFLADYDFTEAS